MNSIVSQPHTVILIGAGHVHLYVAAHAESLIERGARVVLVDPDGFWYSGLAIGMLGGMYEPAEDRVAPQALMEAHGGEFIQDRVETVDTGARRLRLAGGGDLAYDYLSINVGSRVNVDALPGAAHDPTVWSVKPICNLWSPHTKALARPAPTPRLRILPLLDRRPARLARAPLRRTVGRGRDSIFKQELTMQRIVGNCRGWLLGGVALLLASTLSSTISWDNMRVRSRCQGAIVRSSEEC